MRLRKRHVTVEPQGALSTRANIEPLIEVVIRHWDADYGTHTFRTSLTIPLSQAKELRADLDGEIIKAEART